MAWVGLECSNLNRGWAVGWVGRPPFPSPQPTHSTNQPHLCTQVADSMHVAWVQQQADAAFGLLQERRREQPTLC